MYGKRCRGAILDKSRRTSNRKADGKGSSIAEAPKPGANNQGEPIFKACQTVCPSHRPAMLPSARLLPGRMSHKQFKTGYLASGQTVYRRMFFARPQQFVQGPNGAWRWPLV